MGDWQVLAFDLDGRGGMTLNDPDVRGKVEPTRELSGPGAMAVTVSPEQDLVLRPWKTLLVARLDNSIRGTGIVSGMKDAGDGALEVSCVGVTGYYGGMPADMNRTYRDADPAKIIHDMIAWASSRSGTNVGLDLSAYVDSGVRVGNPDPPVSRPVFARRKPTLEVIPPEPVKGKDYYLKGNKAPEVARRKAARDAYSAAMTAWRTRRDAVKDRNKEKERDYNDAVKEHERAVKDYDSAIDDAKVKVQWWDNPTIGGVLDDMAKHVEYRVVPRWVGGKPDHTLQVAKRIGARRPQLRFVVGENVEAAPPVDWAGELFASRVVFLGAGEGIDMIRGEAVGPRDGLARTVVISDKSVRSKKVAAQRAERALRWRQSMPQVTELIVRDDDNAQFGTFDVGDEVRLVGAADRWAGRLDMWVRILSITESSESPTARLTVTRADKGE